MGIWVIGTLAVSLGLTIVLEETFGWMWSQEQVGYDAGCTCECLTNPAVVYLYYMNMIFVGWNRILVTVFLEIAAAARRPVLWGSRARHQTSMAVFQREQTCFPL